MKWIAPVLVYLAVGIGLFAFHSAWGALLGYHAAIILSLLIAKPDIPLTTVIKSRNVKWIMLNVVICGSSGITLYPLWDKFGFASNLPAQVATLGLSEVTWIPFIIYFTLINPFIEEYFWRGYLGNKTEILHTSDFLFAGFHALTLIKKVQMGSIVFALCVLILAGWFWRQVMREDDGLLAPVLGHMAADFTILFAVYRMVI
jgi:membrane protease YdiL (CAAX protease family)